MLSLIWWYFFKALRDGSLSRSRDEILSRGAESAGSEESLISIETGKNRKLKIDTSVPWKTLLSHPSFWAAAVAQYCGANAYFTMFSWLPMYFSDNFPDSQAVVYNVVPSLAIVITALASPFIASRLLSSGRSITFTRRVMEVGYIFLKISSSIV